MYHYWCGCLDHIHKMYMVAVTLPSYPAFRPMFVINILIYKIPKQFSEICGNLRHYLQIVFIFGPYKAYLFSCNLQMVFLR